MNREREMLTSKRMNDKLSMMTRTNLFRIRKAVRTDLPKIAEILTHVGWFKDFEANPAQAMRSVEVQFSRCTDENSHAILVAVDRRDSTVGYMAMHIGVPPFNWTSCYRRFPIVIS